MNRSRMAFWPMVLAAVLALASAYPQIAVAAEGARSASSATSIDLPAWLTQPLSLADCIDLALKQNSDVKKSVNDMEAAYGIAVQTRSIAVPRAVISGSFQANDPSAIEPFPLSGAVFPGAPVISTPNQNWQIGVRVIQSIYEGGKIKSSFRSYGLTQDQAIANHQTVIADTVVSVRVAYDDVLVARQQIAVEDASVKLLQKELEDQKRRFDAGTVPSFNVLRAEVELANERPKLIRARNQHRIAKANLSNLLGFNLPPSVWEDIPLNLTGELQALPFPIELPIAIARALDSRTELSAARKAEALRREDIVTAKSGLKPSVQLFAGYGSHSSSYFDDLSLHFEGWNAGAQMTWNIFDGWLTKGKLNSAYAQHARAMNDIDDLARRVELDVRTAYSNFIEAQEVLESQKKVQEQAEEALRLANARADAGTGTQLDVLSAQTALTQARTTQIQALHDYSVARARLERAMGQTVEMQKAGVK